MAMQVRPNRLSGPELRERRLDAEVTQEILAAELGVTRQRVAMIESLAAPSRPATRRYLAALAAVEAARP
jgi:transcriptional regulator with XRE-family HTH domain